MRHRVLIMALLVLAITQCIQVVGEPTEELTRQHELLRRFMTAGSDEAFREASAELERLARDRRNLAGPGIAPEILAELAQILELDPDPARRIRAAQALGNIAYLPLDIARLLERRRHPPGPGEPADPKGLVQFFANQAHFEILRRMSLSPPRSSPFPSEELVRQRGLLRQLSDRRSSVREEAAKELGRLARDFREDGPRGQSDRGPGIAPEIVEALRHMLVDEGKPGEYHRAALGRMGAARAFARMAFVDFRSRELLERRVNVYGEERDYFVWEVMARSLREIQERTGELPVEALQFSGQERVRSGRRLRTLARSCGASSR